MPPCDYTILEHSMRLRQRGATLVIIRLESVEPGGAGQRRYLALAVDYDGTGRVPLRGKRAIASKTLCSHYDSCCRAGARAKGSTRRSIRSSRRRTSSVPLPCGCATTRRLASCAAAIPHAAVPHDGAVHRPRGAHGFPRRHARRLRANSERRVLGAPGASTFHDRFGVRSEGAVTVAGRARRLTPRRAEAAR